MSKSVQLITYVDRLGQDLEGLAALLDDELVGLFDALHLLPFFDPIDGADAGFDPVDHTSVDARLGDWDAVKRIATRTGLMADLIVNHISSDSKQFQDVKQKAEQSKYWRLFLKKDDVFPSNADAAELKKILRLHPNAPFLELELDNKKTYNFWSTFSDKQLDINVESALGQAYLINILDAFSAAGIKYVRLDAAGFAIKRRNTSCFMLPETFAFLESLTEMAAQRDMQVLVEVHSHYQTQIAIAKKVPWVYDFALPSLVLHTLFTNDSAPLKKWLSVSPRNCITVLDTHDGIGVIEAASEGDLPGLLSDDEVQAVVEQVHINTHGDSVAASGEMVENLDVSQLNTTYYAALGQSDRLYLLARAIQLFVPGIPQIYYVGLLAGVNDMELLARTQNGRDINRHYYEREEINTELERPVVQSLFELIRLRNTASAFDGDFSIQASPDDELHMRWQHGDDSIELALNLATQQAQITRIEKAVVTRYGISGPIISKHLEKIA